MSDNVTLNSGAGGDTIAADDISGVKHQKVKVEWGADDSATPVDNTAAAALPVQQVDNGAVTLQASQVSGVTNTTTSRTTTTGLGVFCDLDITLAITSGGAVTGTLDLFLEDSSDGGTTWDDLVHFASVTFGAAAAQQKARISGRLATSGSQCAAPQQETMAAGVRQGPFGDRIRVREKVSGVSGSPTGVTYSIKAVGKR